MNFWLTVIKNNDLQLENHIRYIDFIYYTLLYNNILKLNTINILQFKLDYMHSVIYQSCINNIH